MATKTIKASDDLVNARPTTELEIKMEEIRSQREIDEANRAERERSEYMNSPDRVIEIMEDRPRRAREDVVNRQDAMVELVAKVPVQVANSAAAAAMGATVGRRVRFRDDYPCLTSFACGFFSGAVITMVAVIVSVFI